jgi:hypothetical protein
MTTALREYLNYSQHLRDIESSTLVPEFDKMSKEKLNSLLSEAIETFSKCRSKENQTTFDRIENRIRSALSKIPYLATYPTNNKTNSIQNPVAPTLKKIAIGVIIAVLSATAVLVINHFFNLGL